MVQNLDPIWFTQPVTTQLRASNPEMMGWFAQFNRFGLNSEDVKKPYRTAFKPFNSFEHVLLAPRLGGAKNNRSERCLVRPIGTRLAVDQDWIDIRNPEREVFHVSAERSEQTDYRTLIARDFQTLVEMHAHSPETKSLGNDGKPCGRMTRGMLFRRSIYVGDIVHIGKEANELELLDARLITDEDSILTIYRGDPWKYVQPVIADTPARVIIDKTGCSRRSAYNWKKGKGHPSGEYLRRLIEVAASAARDSWRSAGYARIPADDIMAVRLYAKYLDQGNS